MELIILSDDFSDENKVKIQNVFKLYFQDIEANIKSLKYFVIGENETDKFIETINDYSQRLNTQTFSENNSMYQVAGKTIEGLDDEGNYCQAIIIKSSVFWGFINCLGYLLENNIPISISDDIDWLGFTTVIHELGHSIDNDNIFTIQKVVNNKIEYDFSNKDEQNEYFIQSTITLWGEFFAESFLYDSYSILKDKSDFNEKNLYDSIVSYYGDNIDETDRVYRILYFYVHALAQKGKEFYKKLENTPLLEYKDFLINFGEELFLLKEKYPDWQINKDLKKIKDIYINMVLFELRKSRA